VQQQRACSRAATAAALLVLIQRLKNKDTFKDLRLSALFYHQSGLLQSNLYNENTSLV